MKKPTKANIRKKLQESCEKLWKKYCLFRDKVCQLCGGKNILQVHHIFSRRIKRLYIDTENGILLCKSCHFKVTNFDTDKETLRRKIDSNIYDRLYEQSLDRSPFLEWKNIAWLETQEKILKELINES